MAQYRLKLDNSGGLQLVSPEKQDALRTLTMVKGFKWNSRKGCWEGAYNEKKIEELALAMGDKLSVSPTVKLIDLKKRLLRDDYSDNTVKSYLAYNISFLEYINKDPSEIVQTDIARYMKYMAETRKRALLTQNIIVNALKYYYGRIRKFDFDSVLVSPKRESRQIVYFSAEEVERIFASLTNMKHRVILKLVYSAGLRVSDLIALRTDDVKSVRGAILVGTTDKAPGRRVPISAAMSEELRHYIKVRNPGYWLFPGQGRKDHLSKRAVERIFEEAHRMAKIRKDASIHNLRHSFAIHALKNGMAVDELMYILGHKSMEVTRKYLDIINPGARKKKKRGRNPRK